MTDINCKAGLCGYNENEKCMKKHINIEGLFAKSKIGTFCQSFKNPHTSSIMKAEMASEIFNEKEYGTKVKCSANYCLYNKDEECTAKQIKVGIEGAHYRSETECDTFKAK